MVHKFNIINCIRITYVIYMLLDVLIPATAQPYMIKRLGVEDGISSNYVVGITQDQQGCMWIATEDGLNKFDGNHFTVYTKHTSGLTSNELNTVLADPNENIIWIATQRNGLCAFNCDQETFTSYIAEKSQLQTNDITDLSYASDGGIWITHYHVGIEHYNPRTKKFTAYRNDEIQGLPIPNWTSCEDRTGHLYIGHAFNGLSILSLKDKTVKNYIPDPKDPNSLPGQEVRAICIDKNDNVWIGTNAGLALFNPTTEKFTVFKHNPNDDNSLLSNSIYDIKQMKDGKIWICTNMGGVSILDLQHNAFISAEEIDFQNIKATNDNYGLSSPNARCAYQDCYGNIWIGNYRGGIDFISHTQPMFNILPYTIETAKGLSYKQVWGMWATDNQVWLGSEDELGLFINGKKIKTYDLYSHELVYNTHINTIYEDRQKRLWLGTYKNGILLYKPDKQEIVHISSSLFNNLDVRCFYEDQNGKMWIGTETGIYSCTNEVLVKEEEIQKQLPDIMVHSLLRDKEGKLWVGTFGKGISIFDVNNKLLWNFVIENGFCSNAVNHMIKDSEEQIWVATREGLAVFKNTSQPNRYKIFKEKEGLENSHIRAICEDLEKRIWISSNDGISCLDPKQNLFYNYNHHDGVPMGDFMNGSTCMTHNGIIYFGSQNGACFFNPKELSSIRQVSPVKITQFCKYNKKTESKDAEISIPFKKGVVHLPYNQNSFRITFNVLDYTQSPQVEFTYMLEGLENRWYDTQGENQVIFRNIPPGKYNFKVRTRIRNQEWDKEIASLNIFIAPPLWLTWYAKLGYVILFIFALYALLRFYKRKLDLESSLEVERKQSLNKQELNEERLRFYTNITHELRTPLTLILGPLEDLLSDATLSPKHANKISIIHDSATRLLNLINRILEFRKTETQNRKLSVAKGDLGQLVQEVGLRYKELNPNNKVNYHIHIETEDTEIFYDADMITIILDNLMSNAAKYTSEGDITLSLRSVEENQIKYTEISVSDTGHGIDAEALPHIFDRYYQAKSKYQASGSGIGLALVKGLSELHEGILKVESTVDTGTTFTLRLLTENTYPNAIHAQHDMEKKPMDAEETTITDTPTENHPIVLVVEDNTDIREYIRSSFTELYEVITAKDGKEGWELAQARIPNIIVSDIMMPVMDGIELCKRIKEGMRTSHIPVILLTAKDSLQDKEEGYASGADSYLTKPFSAKLLHSRINNLLETRKKIASLLALADIQPKQESAVSSLNKLDNEFLQKITQIIEENLEMEKMDIAFIADKMCMSHSTLYRKIKGLTDMSANEFIRKVKMRKGVELLMSGQYTISEIAYMIGFSSVAYFRQCFKDEYGMSPSDYVKQKQ